MKRLKYILPFMTLALLTSCMNGDDGLFNDDWKPLENTANAFGNNNLVETNVISISDLKKKYASTLSNQNDTVCIKEDIQIKARVTGNDIGGNIYNEIAVDDGTAGVLICINSGGLFGYLPVGQEILVSLKGLYFGTYGYQPQIGMPYTNKSGRTFPSRMNRTVWQEHFKLLGQADASKVEPVEFDYDKLGDADYMKDNCGRLMTVKGVKITDATGKNTYAPEDEKDAGNGVSRTINKKNNFVIRSSSYADFAAVPMPTGEVNLTGVFTRYSNTWQILLRTEADVQIVTP